MSTETVKLPPDPLDPGAPTEVTGEIEEIGLPSEGPEGTTTEAAPEPGGPAVGAAPTDAPDVQASDEEEFQNLAGNPNQQVPLRVAQVERRKRQAIQARLQEIEAQASRDREIMARLQERFQIAREAHIAQRQADEQAAMQQQMQLPDPDVDPVGHWKARTQLVEAYAQQQAQQAQQQFQAVQQQQHYQQQIMQVQGAVQQFASRQPDYYDALAFVRDKRDRDLQTLGVSDPAQRAHMIAMESENMIVKPALDRGQNPAQIAYELAKSWGYTPRGAAPAAQQPARPVPGNGAARMANLERGAAASRTLSNVQTTTSAGEMPSLEALLSLPEEDFDRFYAKNQDLVEGYLEGKI